MTGVHDYNQCCALREMQPQKQKASLVAAQQIKRITVGKAGLCDCDSE